MATATIVYGTPTAATITLTSLASSSTLLVGRESTAIDNQSTLALDYIVGGKITAGAGTPIAGTVEYWAYGSYDGTTYGGVATGSDAGLTNTGPDKMAMAQLLVQQTDTTASHVYKWGPFSIAAAFGGVVPLKFGFFIAHNMSAALGTTAAGHEVKYTSVKYASA